MAKEKNKPVTYIPITWQQFAKDAVCLAKKIQNEYGRVDEIVAISRGGIVLGRILSDILEANISFITMLSYEGLKQTKRVQITRETPRKFNNEKILLVDELADSGKTFITAVNYLKKLPVKTIITASLYIKPKTKYVPHVYIKRLDGWIILPYELKETKAAFIEQFGLEGAKKKLKQLGVLDWSSIS